MMTIDEGLCEMIHGGGGKWRGERRLRVSTEGIEMECVFVREERERFVRCERIL